MPAFDRPTIEDVQLDQHCIDTLELIDARDGDGGAATSLLAWSPLVFVLSNPNPISIVFTIATTDWESLIQGVQGLERIRLLSNSRDCALAAAHHNRNRKLREFWTAMYDFYSHQANSLRLQNNNPKLVDGKKVIRVGGIELQIPTDMDDKERAAMEDSFGDHVALVAGLKDRADCKDDSITTESNKSFNINGRSYDRKRRFVRVATGATRWQWQGLRSRLKREYKHFYIFDNPSMYSASDSAKVEAFLVCVAGLSIILLIGISTGIFEPVSFTAVMTACGALLAAASLEGKAVFEVKNHWE